MQHEIHPRTFKALCAAFLRDDAAKHSELLLRVLRAGSSSFKDIVGRHPLADEWLDFGKFALEQHLDRTKGFVYVLTTPQYPETIKIGMTALTPEQRLRRLNNESVIWHFECAGAVSTHDRRYLESSTHQALRNRGVVNHKEFFRYDPVKGLALVQKLQSQDAAWLLARLPGLVLKQ